MCYNHIAGCMSSRHFRLELFAAWYRRKHIVLILHNSSIKSDIRVLWYRVIRSWYAVVKGCTSVYRTTKAGSTTPPKLPDLVVWLTDHVQPITRAHSESIALMRWLWVRIFCYQWHLVPVLVKSSLSIWQCLSELHTSRFLLGWQRAEQLSHTGNYPPSL